MNELKTKLVVLKHFCFGKKWECKSMSVTPDLKLIKVADLYYWLAQSIFDEELLGLSRYYFITTFIISLLTTFTLMGRFSIFISLFTIAKSLKLLDRWPYFLPRYQQNRIICTKLGCYLEMLWDSFWKVGHYNNDSSLLLFVCFPGVTTPCGCIFHSPVAGFSLFVVKVSWSHTTTHHIR
jgi:hypothetical protein